jgi:protein involved in polysaccharide export with SLBB domain
MRINPFGKFWLLFVLILCAACSTKQTSTESPQTMEFPQAPEISTSKEPVGDYLLLPGDTIEIKFFYHPQLNEKVNIGPDGKISLQLIDDIQAAGLSTSQLDEILTQEYDRYLKNYSISVMVREYSGFKVYVGGEVSHPGFLLLGGNMTIMQSIVAKGGHLRTAKTENVVLIRKGPGGKPVAMTVDLNPVIAGEHLENDLYLMPSDIVFVPKTWVAKAGDFTDLVLRKLLFFNNIMSGVGGALGYQWVIE